MTIYLRRFGIDEIDFKHDGENNLDWAYAKLKAESLAYELLKKKEHPNGIKTVLPADTWHQPFALTDEQKEVNAQIALKSFDEFIKNGQIDQASDVFYTREFARALRSFDFLPEEHRGTLRSACFANTKRFHFYLGSDNRKMLLRDARNLMKMIGASVDELIVDGLFKAWPENSPRYLFKISQLTGPNIQSLVLKNIPADTTWVKPMKSVLERIKALDISTDNYDFVEYDLDLQEICPNLRSLKVKMNMKGGFLVKHWPSLEKFSNQHNQYMEERLVTEFMKNNPQIKYLKVDANDCNRLTKEIVEYLPKLESLCLIDAYPDIAAANVTPLLELKYLERLKLESIREGKRNEILSCVTQFAHLKVLKLYFIEDEVDAESEFEWKSDLIVNISKSLHRLEAFHLHFFLLEENAVFDFIRNAKKLKILDVRGCNLSISPEFLEKIVEIRGSSSRPALQLISYRADVKVPAESVS